VTERCVFALREYGIALVEVAPGIDIARDILAQMDFKPLIARDPAVMDRRIFHEDPMGLRDDLLRIPLERRFTYDPQQNLFFVNFEGLVVRTRDDVERIRRLVEEAVAPVGHKVYAIVNYDRFSILPEVIDDYTAMVKELVDRLYSGVTRYTTSGFLRTKLGDALAQREVAPHIYESAEEARAFLRELEGKTAS
jgi:propionate CoA-transferase